MTFRKTVSGFLLAMALAGCAVSGRVGDLPVLKPEDHGGNLVLMRARGKVPNMLAYYVNLDGMDVFIINQDEFTAFRVPTGEHVVSVRFADKMTPSPTDPSYRFKAHLGEYCYIEIREKGGVPQIQEINETKARYNMAVFRFIDPERLIIPKDYDQTGSSGKMNRTN